MPVTIERSGEDSVIRLDGAVTIEFAQDLKAALAQAIGAVKALRLDLDRVERIDVTGMQLLWAAGREVERGGGEVVCTMSQAAAQALRDGGFRNFPGVDSQ